MRNGSNSEWMAAWSVLLLCIVAWITLDYSAADRFLQGVVQRWDFNQILVAALILIGAVNLFALAFRILTWRNE